MKYEKQTVRQYILQQTEIELPKIQKKLELTYAELKPIVDELIKEEMLAFVSGVSYKIKDRERSQSVYRARNEQEKENIKALWKCIISGVVTVSHIRRECKMNYFQATSALEWMEENGYVTPYPNREIQIGKEEFIKKFGKPDEEAKPDKDALSEEEERQKYIEERRRTLMERLRRMNEDEDDSDDEDEDEEDDSLITCDTEDFDSHMQRLLDDITEDDKEDNDKKDEDSAIDLKSLIIECLKRGLQDKSSDEKCIFGLDGELQFELKLVQEDNALRISDGGKTFAAVGQTARKVKNVLKNYAPVVLDSNGELSITIENPYGTFMAILTLYAATDAVKKMK